MQRLKPGFLVGSYRVVRELGTGGMGAVYEVEHVTLGVHYALKTFVLENRHAELFRKRFLAEGRLLARLNHPGLVRVFDLAYDAESDLLYCVMDLVLYKDNEAHTLAGGGVGIRLEGQFDRPQGSLCQHYAHDGQFGEDIRDWQSQRIILAIARL